jgi:predicted tellurium resistance membrane protein TerC
MTTTVRSLIYLGLLILLGIGIRLMYYGLETVVGSSPHYNWLDVVLLLLGVVLFVCGIITGILGLSRHSPARS